MADLTQFLLGFQGSDFVGLKTTDNIYLKDVLQDVADSLAEYNSRSMALAQMLCYKHTEAVPNKKKGFSTDEFKEIGEIQTPGDRRQIDLWDVPLPIRRYGSYTGLTMESLKKMSSSDLTVFHNAKMLADQKNIIKNLFTYCCTKAPSAVVDVLEPTKAIKYNPFWNDESSMDTPRSNGQITFDGDHQHYDVVATANTLVEADVDDKLIAEIKEHENMDQAQIILWARTGTTVNYIKGLTSFKSIIQTGALLTANGVPYNTSGAVQALIRSFQLVGATVKIVGTYKEALVVETPDIVANYILATAYFGDNDNRNPMGWREHPQFQGLMLVSNSGANPVIGVDAQYRRYLGLGVQNRDAGACLYTAHNSTWAEPTFA